MLTELRYALRTLAKSPGFSVVAVVILALGIGASTAIFTVVNTLLLSPLPYADSRQLVQVQSQHPEQGVSVLAPATFFDVAAQTKTLSVLASQTYDYVNLTKFGPPALVTGLRGTVDYFKLFGVSPLLGRTWLPEETKSGAAPVVILSQTLWENQYGGDRDLIGKEIMIDDRPHTVLGVMPASFKDPWGNSVLWRPMDLSGDVTTNRASRYFSTFARIAPGFTPAQVDAELATLAQQLAQTYPDNYRGWTLNSANLHGLVVGDYRSGLLVVLGAVGCVMLITCANVAGLTLVRATARRKELAIRTALGASRAQIIRQLLIESLLLALIGGGLGVLVGGWGLDALLASVPEGWLPRADEISLNAPVLTAALALTLLTGLAFGLAPGLTATRIDANDALKDNARGSGGPAARRLRSGLVVAEIALALVLLVGAALFARNFIGLLTRDSGFEAKRVLSMTLLPSAARYDSPAKLREFYTRAEAEVAAVPGVQSAGFTQTSPFRWGIPMTLLPVPINGPVLDENVPQTFYDSVSADYFKSIGSALRAGRVFDATDVADGKPVVILSESTARRLFGQENPLGRSVTNGATSKTRLEVIGVVADVRRIGLAAEIPLQAYRSIQQRPTAFATLMVRTTLPPATLAKSVQEALWRVDADLPISNIAPMDEVMGNTVTKPKLYLTLFGLFAGIALCLAGIGLYGLIAYSVAQRTREFGIRSALGANASDILRLVLRESTHLVALGLSLGLLGAFATARVLQQMLFQTSAYDPLSFISVPLILAAVALTACLIPARRAARVDPAIALRAE